MRSNQSVGMSYIMADEEYKRLGCMASGCEQLHKAKGLCQTHYRRLQRHGSYELSTGLCAHCGQGFTKNQCNAIYCSKRCKMAAWVVSNPERWVELNERKVSAVFAGYCATCGNAFVSRKTRTYCKDSCRPRAEGSSYELGRYYTPPVRTCGCCGLQWSAIRRVGCSTFCPSPECQVARRQANKAARGNKSHIQRAKKHGRRYGYFNVLRVLARDRWTCQVCGVKTPKRLRGAQVPNAPELGHIVAIADGGDHVIENCQCECRACNAAKGIKAQGQMWLTGFADTKG